MSKKNNIYTLEQNLIEELNDNKEEILNSSYPEDLINDYADGWIPIYNWDVLETAQSDLYLLNEADEDETGGSIIQKIQTAIYYRLTDAGNKWLQDNQDQEVA
jgi:DNA-binding PadR family transcriptional regulator